MRAMRMTKMKRALIFPCLSFTLSFHSLFSFSSCFSFLFRKPSESEWNVQIQMKTPSKYVLSKFCHSIHIYFGILSLSLWWGDMTCLNPFSWKEEQELLVDFSYLFIIKASLVLHSSFRGAVSRFPIQFHYSFFRRLKRLCYYYVYVLCVYCFRRFWVPIPTSNNSSTLIPVLDRSSLHSFILYSIV